MADAGGVREAGRMFTEQSAVCGSQWMPQLPEQTRVFSVLGDSMQ
jgi:hypothetical protein